MATKNTNKETIENPVDNLKALKDLKGILFNHTYTTKNTEDKPTKKVVVLPNFGGLYQEAFKNRQISMEEIKANPVLAIKKDVRLARFTNATEEQVKLITKTTKYQLQKL